MTDNTQPLALMLADRLHHEQPTVLRIDAELAGEELRRQHACIAELEAQLESIGAGGVNSPLMGQPQAMPDLTALTERGAKAWAGVDAQALREGGASPTPQADSQPAPMGQNESAYQRGYMDGMAKGRREAEAGGHAAPQPAVQQGDTEVLLIAAVDEWFAKNTGLGGCSDKDVQELQAIFAADRAARALEDSVTAPAGGGVTGSSMREEFEAYWRSKYAPLPMNTRLHDDGRYGDPTIQQEWDSRRAIHTPTPPTQAAESQPAPVLDRARIREIFMARGFTVKEGQTDLKQYVYDAADALLRAARAPADSVPVARFDDPKVQAVYAILCSDVQPPEGEHWEGFAARRIVDALSADSVLEDAARYEYLRDCTMGERNRLEHYSGPALDVVIDAARKQGANHDNS